MASNFVTQLCLFVIVVALLAGVGFSQIDQGAISGNVLDPSGAVIAGAKITAKGVLTGSVYETVSSSAGAYRFPNMRIGTYNVSVTAAGFKTAQLTGVVAVRPTCCGFLNFPSLKHQGHGSCRSPELVCVSDSPLEQFTAFRIRLYCVPICAIEPSMTALLPVRWQISCEISGVSFASAGCPIRRKVRWMACSGTMLRKGDCSSCTVSPCRRVPPNTASPVLLTRSARTIVSLSVSGLLRCER